MESARDGLAFDHKAQPGFDSGKIPSSRILSPEQLEELRDWPSLEGPDEPSRPPTPSRRDVLWVRLLVVAGVCALAAFLLWLCGPARRGDPWLFWPLFLAFGFRALCWLLEWVNYARPKFEPAHAPRHPWAGGECSAPRAAGCPPPQRQQAAAVHGLRHRAAWFILLATALAAPLRAAPPLERTVNAACATNDPARFREAARALEDDLRQHRANLANRKSLGFIYLDKLKEPRAALPHLEKVAEALPRDSGWWQMLARAYADAGQREAAAEAYRHAAAHHPRDVWARYHLGRTLRELHRTREARAAFAEALALDPANPHVLLELAQLDRKSVV